MEVTSGCILMPIPARVWRPALVWRTVKKAHAARLRRTLSGACRAFEPCSQTEAAGAQGASGETEVKPVVHDAQKWPNWI